MSPTEILSSLKAAYRAGARTLTIHSRRQDIGIQKCAWGVREGYLKKEILEIDEQETHWRYRVTDKAQREWGE